MCEGKKKKLFQYAEFGNTTVFDMMLFHFHSLHAVAYVLCNVANTHTHSIRNNHSLDYTLFFYSIDKLLASYCRCVCVIAKSTKRNTHIEREAFA